MAEKKEKEKKALVSSFPFPCSRLVLCFLRREHRSFSRDRFGGTRNLSFWSTHARENERGRLQAKQEHGLFLRCEARPPSMPLSRDCFFSLFFDRSALPFLSSIRAIQAPSCLCLCEHLLVVWFRARHGEQQKGKNKKEKRETGRRREKENSLLFQTEKRKTQCRNFLALALALFPHFFSLCCRKKKEKKHRRKKGTSKMAALDDASDTQKPSLAQDDTKETTGELSMRLKKKTKRTGVKKRTHVSCMCFFSFFP